MELFYSRCERRVSLTAGVPQDFESCMRTLMEYRGCQVTCEDPLDNAEYLVNPSDTYGLHGPRDASGGDVSRKSNRLLATFSRHRLDPTRCVGLGLHRGHGESTATKG